MVEVIVRRTGALGDAVLATAAVRHLARLGHRVSVQTACPDAFHASPHAAELLEPGRPLPPGSVLVDLDLAYERNPLRSALDGFSDAVEAAGFPPLPRDDRLPELFGWEPVRFADSRPHVAVHAARSWASRTLPTSFWFGLMAELRRAGAVVVAVGTSRDLATGPRCDLPLADAASVVASCSALVGADSAMLHVAVAVSTPAVGLYTSVRPERRIPPGANVVPLLPEGLDCVGCLERRPVPCTNLLSCERGDTACVWRFSAARVADAVLRLACAARGG